MAQNPVRQLPEKVVDFSIFMIASFILFYYCPLNIEILIPTR